MGVTSQECHFFSLFLLIEATSRLQTLSSRLTAHPVYLGALQIPFEAGQQPI